MSSICVYGVDKAYRAWSVVFSCTRFKAGMRPGIACTCASVEVHAHSCETLTECHPIMLTVVVVYTI